MPNPDYTILTGQLVKLDGVDYSLQSMDASLEVKVDTVDLTNFKSKGWKLPVGTLKSGDLKVELIMTPAIVSALWNKLGQLIPFILRTDGDTAIGVGNLEFRGSALNSGFKPIGGKVGEPEKSSLAWPTSGEVTLHVAA